MPRLLVIVRADDRARANQDWRQFDKSGGQDTFAVALNADGSPETPVSHYWCATQVSNDAVAQLWALRPRYLTMWMEWWDMDTDPTYPDRLLAVMGLQRIRAHAHRTPATRAVAAAPMTMWEAIQRPKPESRQLGWIAGMWLRIRRWVRRVLSSASSVDSGFLV